jgi:hypothetical protein
MTTALKVTIAVEALPGMVDVADNILVVNACGVSGGDRVLELRPGHDHQAEFWMGAQGRISVFPKEKE